MNHKISIFIFVILIQHLAPTHGFAASDFSVMTFNVRHAAVENKNTGDYVVKDKASGDEWKKRKSHVIKAILSKSPDILGVQELSYAGTYDVDPREYVSSKLSNNYDFYKGIGGSPKNIYYKPDKFVVDVNNSGAAYVWPDPRSTICPGSGGAGSTRSFTWATFTQLNSGKRLFVVNTHLHNGSNFTTVRKKQIECIRKHIRQHSQGMPVVLMGDLNSKASGPEICALERGFGADQLPLFDASGKDTESTYNHFQANYKFGQKIDYVFLRGLKVDSHPEVVRYSYYDRVDNKVRWPSDHYPVYTELSFHRHASYVNTENRHCGANSFSLFW